MTDGKMLSADCFSVWGNFLTTVRRGERFFKPPKGSLGAPIVNIRNSLFWSSVNSLRTWRKLLKVWLPWEYPCIGMMFSLR